MEDLVSDLLDMTAVHRVHFRAGSCSCLEIERDRDLVLWTFTFLDFGMWHSTSGRVRVEEGQGGVLVNGRLVRSTEQARRAAFAGRYERFARRLWARFVGGPRQRARRRQGRGPGL